MESGRRVSSQFFIGSQSGTWEVLDKPSTVLPSVESGGSLARLNASRPQRRRAAGAAGGTRWLKSEPVDRPSLRAGRSASVCARRARLCGTEEACWLRNVQLDVPAFARRTHGTDGRSSSCRSRRTGERGSRHHAPATTYITPVVDPNPPGDC